jgi:hypothetical protein
LPFAFIWTRYAANTGWSAVSQLGTNNTQVAALTVAVIALMLALAVLRTSAKKWKTMPAALRWYPLSARANKSAGTT